MTSSIKSFSHNVYSGGASIKEAADRGNNASDPASGYADIIQDTEMRSSAFAARKAVKGTGHTVVRSARRAVHIKTKMQAAKEGIHASKESIKAVNHTIKASGKQISASIKTGKTMIKSAASAARTAQQAVSATAKSFQVAQKTAQASLKAAQISARVAAEVTKTSVKAAVTAVKVTVQAAIAVGEAIGAAIAAGGWIAVVCILAIVLIAAIISSALGVFSGAETDGQTLTSVQQEINEELSEKISAEKKKMKGYERIEVRPAEFITEWNNIVSVYAVRSQNSGFIAGELNESNIELLRQTVWDMVSLEISEEEEEIPNTSEDAGKDEKPPKEEEKKMIGVITLKYKTLDEAAKHYHFSDEDSELMMMVLQMSTGGNFIGGSGNGKMINPCPGGVFNGNDYPYYPSGGYHAGRDISCPIGTPVYAAADGVVIHVNDQADSYGNHIMISHGNDIYTLYAHNSQLLVSVGDTVKQGQQIAVSGSTGNSTGPHLHFEVRAGGSRYRVNNVDPLEWIE